MDDYFEQIESHFAAKRGTVFILSAKDWLLMKQWKADGIPFALVIEAIDSVFEKNEASGRKKTVNSLSYCRHAVKELWSVRKALTVGGNEVTPEESPALLLERLAQRLEPLLPLRAAALRALVQEKSVPRIEEGLMALENEVIEELLATLEPGETEALRSEARSALSGSGGDEATRKRTEEAILKRLVRERFQLPRLSLF